MKISHQNYFVLLLIVFLNIFSAVARDQATKTSVPSEVPSTMYAFRSHLLELQPYLISEEAFTASANEDEVKKHLEAFANFSKSLKMHKRLKAKGFEFTANQLEQHLGRTYEIFKDGNKSFAWWLFRSAIHGCNQCHTQVAYRSAPSLEFEEASISGTPFDQAEFWYTIRDYKRAMLFYNSVISRFGQDAKTTKIQLVNSLRKILSITLRIDRSPKKALDIMSSAKEHSQIPADTKNLIDSWIRDLKKLEKTDIPIVKTTTPKQFDKYISNLMGPISKPPYDTKKDDVSSIFVSGLLQEFVNQRPKNVTPEMLYRLGVSLESTENDIFFTTSEHYFKNCIEKFHSSPIARQCFEALKDKWTMGFTGSAGSDLPKEYQLELDRLESKLKPLK
ncbi:MAG: hypothetical protein KDD48_03770 [Bdellovibrionales bacterium]|nr:hypothetical protein [Bdellovibrionales bacterium]